MPQEPKYKGDYMDCLFCRIVAGEIPAKVAYEDDQVLAFYDIEPQAPVHILVIPKRHISSVAELKVDDGDLLAAVFAAIGKLTRELKLDDGFRVVSNVGEVAGQSVRHLHFHVLSGKPLSRTFG